MKTTRIILFAFIGGTSTVGLVVLLMLIQPIISALIPGRSSDRPGHLEPSAEVQLATPVLPSVSTENQPEPASNSEPEPSVVTEPEPETSSEPVVKTAEPSLPLPPPPVPEAPSAPVQ